MEIHEYISTGIASGCSGGDAISSGQRTLTAKPGRSDWHYLFPETSGNLAVPVLDTSGDIVPGSGVL